MRKFKGKSGVVPRSAEPLCLSKFGAIRCREGRGRELVLCVSEMRVVEARDACP